MRYYVGSGRIPSDVYFREFTWTTVKHNKQLTYRRHVVRLPGSPSTTIEFNY